MSNYTVVLPEEHALTQTFIREASVNTNSARFTADGPMEWSQRPLNTKAGKRRILISQALFRKLAKSGTFGKTFQQEGIFPC